MVVRHVPSGATVIGHAVVSASKGGLNRIVRPHADTLVRLLSSRLRKCANQKEYIIYGIILISPLVRSCTSEHTDVMQPILVLLDRCAVSTNIECEGAKYKQEVSGDWPPVGGCATKIHAIYGV